jgi:hypothetical protein
MLVSHAAANNKRKSCTKVGGFDETKSSNSEDAPRRIELCHVRARNSPSLLNLLKNSEPRND